MLPRRHGGVPERLNGAVSKTVVGLTVHRGFESLPLRSIEPNPARDAGSRLSLLLVTKFLVPAILDGSPPVSARAAPNPR